MHCSPVHPGTWNVPVSFIVVAGVIAPVRRPASAVTSLNVEPGAYWPCSARLLSGKRLLGSLSCVHRSLGMGLVNSAGS